MEYAILDTTGRCINRMLWDGETEWQPPEGCTAVSDPEGSHQIAPTEEATSNGAPLELVLEEPQAGDPAPEES